MSKRHIVTPPSLSRRSQSKIVGMPLAHSGRHRPNLVIGNPGDSDFFLFLNENEKLSDKVSERSILTQPPLRLQWPAWLPGGKRQPVVKAVPETTRARAGKGKKTSEEAKSDAKQHMPTTKQKLPPIVRTFAPGAVAGAVSRTATAPLEAIRVKLMVGGGNVQQVINSTWQNGGLFAFWRGNGADVLRVVPQKAIQLGCFDFYKSALARPVKQPELSPEEERKRRRRRKKDGDGDKKVKKTVAPWAVALAGSMAGVTSTVACYPLETLRTRLALSAKDGRAYKGIVDCFTTMVRTEGAHSLYNGIGASLIGVIPYAAINLGMYDALRWSCQRTHTLRMKSEAKKRGEILLDEDVPPFPKVFSIATGATAGVMAATATFPIEVVRRRMMAGIVSGNPITAIYTIYQTQGISALFAGCTMNWIKLAPSAGLSFYVYELMRDVVNK